MPVGSIGVQNLDSDFSMSYEVMDDVEVHIRGPKAVLNSYDIEGSASIDLSAYKEAGTYTVPIIVELPEGCSLEDDVNVQIILTEKK